MGYWVKQSEDKFIPDWLRSNLNCKCTCGSEKENYYNDDNRCTARRCSSLECSEVVAQKIASMCDILSVVGVKEGNSRRLVRTKSLKNHFDAIPHLFTSKPTISLFTLFRLAFIKGVDGEWANVTANYSSVEEVINNYKGKYLSLIKENEEVLKYGETKFDIIKPAVKEFKAILTGNIMLTGDILGLKDRKDFIAAINQSSKGLVDFRVVGQRKTGVLCLIKAASTPVYGKVKLAIEQGAPVYTPEEFIEWVKKELSKKLEETKNE